MTIKALSFTRPWTDLILRGEKTVENRSWSTTYRGVLVVHGAKSWDPDARRLFDALVGLMPDEADAWAPRDKTASSTGYLGTVTVTGCHRAGDLLCDDGCDWHPFCSPWAFEGNWHWALTEARRFPEPVPGNGRLGLWTPPDDVLAAVGRVWSPLRTDQEDR